MPRTKVSFTTCNLYNLNEPGLPMYRNQTGWEPAQYDKKINWLASQLKSLDSDVWAFQELWHQQSLHQAFTRAELSGDYRLLVPDSHQGDHILCAGAVKTNILVGEPEWITDFPQDFHLASSGDDDQTSDIAVTINTFSRPVLHFTIKPRTDGKVIHVYVAHFKSKRPTDIYREGWYESDRHKIHSEALGSALSTIRRTAEATALRMMITSQTKGTDTPVVLMGDLNDNQGSNTLNILTGQPNYLLAGYSKGGSDVDLYSVGTLQEYRSRRDVYYTHVFKNNQESLDHILVSQEFYDNSRKRIWAFKGMEVLNDHLNHHDHKETGSVDHGLVKAEFEYRPA